MADLSKDKMEVKTPIIMKVDAPPEDNNILTSQAQGSSMNNTEQSETVKTPMRSLLQSPRLNSNNKLVNNPKLNVGVVLRPSQLGPKIENKSKNPKNPFALNPSRLNPFARAAQSFDSSPEKDSQSSNSNKNGTGYDGGSDHSNSSSTASKLESNSDSNSVSPPKFVPLVVTTETPKSGTNVSTIASTSNFVFGQNLHERVVSESENEASSSENASTSCTNANGTSELLFSSAAKKNNTQESNKEVKSLTESAREYEESRANKRKYDEVQVVTGEEDEKNVLQINCKLFAFDKATSNWQERGRGALRLNDKEITAAENLLTYKQSRLVFRTSGSLRVVLNTKIWAEMTIDRASVKSLRLTAMDATGQIKVFLIMASQEELNQLQRLLESRVKCEVERQKQLKINSEPAVKKQAIENNGQ